MKKRQKHFVIVTIRPSMGIVAVNAIEGWSRDATADVAGKVGRALVCMLLRLNRYFWERGSLD